MASRFGRNQRRKMREQIAQLNKQHTSETEARKLAESYERETRYRLDAWAADIRNLLGNDSVFNERYQSLVAHTSMAPYMRIPKPLRTIDVSVGRPAMEMIASDEAILAAIWRINMDRDQFTGMVRVELTNDSGVTCALAVTKGEMPRTNQDIECLGKMIASKFVRFLERR
jgi:hypothetical protein